MASHLHWADYLILVIFLVVSLAIGIYHSLTGGRQRTTAEFIMANRKLSVIPTAISLLVSFQSAILFLGLCAEMYDYGIQFPLYFALAALPAFLFVERLIVPWIFPLKLVSIYDYLEMRFGSKSVRIFGASLGISNAVLVMGVAMYAPSAALESATGLPLSVSIPAMAVVTVAYTALGGMRAVIWTDVFQFFIMIGGMIAVCVKGLVLVGGIGNVFRFASEEGRLVWANWSIDPRERNTVWSIMIGMGLNWINSFGFQQAAAQRYSAVNTLSKARTTMLIIAPVAILMDAMLGFIGMIVMAYYASIKCDPIVNKEIANPNMLLPYFVVTIFADSPGFSGLFLATLYGATLSTVSSLLSGAAANVWEDILKWKLSHLPETRKAFINKVLVVLFGVIAVGIAFLSASVPGPMTQVIMALFGSVTGPMVAFFILGAVSKHANWKGILVGGVVGLLVTLWLSIGSMTVRHKHPPLPALSVERCSSGRSNSTVFPSTPLNYTDYASFHVSDGNGLISNWNQTTRGIPLEARLQAPELEGLENFYAVSYLWFATFGAVITGVVGIITSLITRDRDLEAKVDDRLLMRMHGCGWSDESEKKEEFLDENKYIMLQQGTQEPNVDLCQNSVMTGSKETENQFQKDINGDSKKEKENTVTTKDDTRTTSSF